MDMVSNAIDLFHVRLLIRRFRWYVVWSNGHNADPHVRPDCHQDQV